MSICFHPPFPSPRSPSALSILSVVLCLFAPAALLPHGQAQNAAGERTADLRPLWRDGQSARYEVRTTRVTTSTNADGQAQTRTVEVEAVIDWTVTDTADPAGGAVDMAVTQMTLNLDNGERTFEVTADRAPEPLRPVRDLVRAFTDHTVRVTVDASGRITGVDGWQAIRADAGVAGESLVEADFIEMAVELAPLAGGARQREPGRTWTESFTFSHEFGQMRLASEYQFVGVEQIADIPVALVNRESEIDYRLDRERTGMDQSNDAFSIDWRVLEAEQSAEIMFDLTRHEVVGMNMSRSLIFEIDTRIRDRNRTGRMTEQLNTQILRLSEQ